MFGLLYSVLSKSLLVLLVSIVSVNYLPEKLFHDFPLEPRSVEQNDFDSVIPHWNTKLSDNQPEYIQLNNILGPESIAVSKDGFLYTGLADGRLVELDPSKNYKLRQVLKFKQSPECPDNSATHADKCGRFLQLRFVNGTLYALEANTGLYKVDVMSGTKTFLGPKNLNKVNLFNSFAFDPKETNLVYISISSTKWDLLKILWSLLELENSGQLLALDISTGKQVILFDKLSTANGVEVDSKRDRLLFAETSLGRINAVKSGDARAAFKIAKDGEKLSKNLEKTPLIPLLPGFPDNIIVEDDLAYIALPFVKHNGKELVDYMSTMPNLRKAIGRFVFGSGKLLEYVSQFVQHPVLEEAYRELKCGHISYRFLQTDKSAVIEYNLATGSSKFLGSDKFGFVSEAVPDNKGNLLLGSFRSSFIVKVKV